MRHEVPQCVAPARCGAMGFDGLPEIPILASRAKRGHFFSGRRRRLLSRFDRVQRADRIGLVGAQAGRGSAGGKRPRCDPAGGREMIDRPVVTHPARRGLERLQAQAVALTSDKQRSSATSSHGAILQHGGDLLGRAADRKRAPARSRAQVLLCRDGAEFLTSRPSPVFLLQWPRIGGDDHRIVVTGRGAGLGLPDIVRARARTEPEAGSRARRCGPRWREPPTKERASTAGNGRSPQVLRWRAAPRRQCGNIRRATTRSSGVK